MRLINLRWTSLCGVLLLLLATATVEACPSCKAANEANPRLPQAYQLSILFMLGVPSLMMGGFGYGLYRLNKIQEQAVADFESGRVWDAPPQDESTGEKA